MRVLDLFSGIGGFALAGEAEGFETVAFCENDKHAQKLLKLRFPEIPIYNDIKTLNKERLDNDGIANIDLVTGGFPCQPYSIAGERNPDDDRILWHEMFRLIKEIRPRWVIGENVTGIITMDLDFILDDLGSANYESRTVVIPACSKGASHRRDRVWILSHRIEEGLQGREKAGNDAGEGEKSQHKLFA